MARLILTVGLPGSGKSTWAEQQVDENTVRVNRDDLREELFGASYHSQAPDYRSEQKVSREQDRRITEALKNGKTVICDDTNLNPKFIRQKEALALDNNAELEFEYFNTPVEECLRRNEARAARGGRLVPPAVIRKMAERSYREGLLKIRKNASGGFEFSSEVAEDRGETVSKGSESSGNPRYHLSPDGVPRKCSARFKCEFASPSGIEPAHYETKESAERAFETLMNSENISTISGGGETRLDSVVSAKEFQRAIDAGLITERAHPEDENLRVYSYSRKVQFEGLWTPETLLARGLILDVSEGLENGVIKARALGKFFTVDQMQEGDWTRLKVWDDDEGFVISENEEIDFDSPAIVSEKLNGALGVLYEAPSGRLAISTKGSFSSLEANVGSKVIADRDNEELEKILKTSYEGKTPLFEIITPERPHPVDYGNKEDVIFLGTVDNASGEWLPAVESEPLAKVFESSVRSEAASLREALERPYEENTEGFVVTVGSGAEQKMYKVKPQEYHDLRRLFYNATDPRKLSEIVKGMSYEDYVLAFDDPERLSLNLEDRELSPTMLKVVERARKTISSEWLKSISEELASVRALSESFYKKSGGVKSAYAGLVIGREDQAALFAGFDEIESGSSEKLFRVVRDTLLKK